MGLTQCTARPSPPAHPPFVLLLSDGSLYLATPIDPLFLALPILAAARKKSASHPGYFLSCAALFTDAQRCPPHLFTGAGHSLTAVCDEKEGWESKVYRLSDERVLEWLKGKVEALQVSLAALPRASPLSASSILVSSLSLVSEYVTSDVLLPLLSFYHLTEADLHPRSKAAQAEVEVVGADSLTERRSGRGGGGAVKEKKKAVSAASKKLQKVNTERMPSLSAMWGLSKGGGGAKS
jgi:hypothetical protein